MNDKKIAAFVGFDVRETDKILQQMTSILSDFLHSASCGISRIYQKTGQLGRSYEEAQCALNYKQQAYILIAITIYTHSFHLSFQPIFWSI